MSCDMSSDSCDSRKRILFVNNHLQKPKLIKSIKT